ncbi:MAG: DUF3857 domain-containing protein [Ginsengibacter sp.]
MLSKKNTGFLLVLLLLQFSVSAQDKLKFKFGKVSVEDFDVKSPLIDSSTNAVVIGDVGKSQFVANSNELSFSLIFTQKKRMKIINKNGFDIATVTIPLYVSDNNKAEKLSNLDAYTYNLENGKIVETKVDKSSVFTEKHSKNWIYNKFTFPNLKEGSIIEYSYQVKSDFFFNLQPWTFQGEYPVLWSQYEAGIPEFYQYVTLSQGYQPFFINKIDNSSASYSFVEHESRAESTGFKADNSSKINRFTVDGKMEYHTWVMKDVPALKEEAFTTTLRNSVAKIEFQINAVVFPNSAPHNYMDTWETVASQLMENESFGTLIERPNNWLDKDVNDIVGNASTLQEKSRKIYEYVRDNFTWNNNNSIYVTSNLKDVFKNKTGSVADINMLLIAMLRNQKIEANPIILSTRDNGFTHEFYPLINRYNYLIAKAVIDSKEYYLDATTRQLEFGILPSRTYNGQAREIAKNNAMPVYLVADSLKEMGATYIYISQDDKGSVEGSFKHNFGVYESLKMREKMTKTSQEDLKKALQVEYPEDVTIDNFKLDSLKLLNLPVALNCDLKFKSFEDADIVYFNPMLDDALKNNPFAAAERFYPVEMPYAIDKNYFLTMQIPKGYKVDELPKSARVNFNEDEGMFEYLLSADKDLVQMRCRLLLKKATFLNEDYQSLRDFYAFVVSKEAEQIVFKKVK